MTIAFTKIAFTPSVKAVQSLQGSRASYARMERDGEGGHEFSAQEIDYIQARDSFYQATVSETGWPYVQFRGGPAGFLRVLGPKTLGYADFRGNRQYISVGNINADERMALILMDYPNRRRLKIWGRARVVHASDDAELLARLEVPAYGARVERAVVIDLEAFDWNCPQHITPRFTEAEIAQWAAAIQERVASLEEENAQLLRSIRNDTNSI